MNQYYIWWLIVVIALAALITAIIRYGNFRKEEKRAETYAKLLYDYNTALEKQGEAAKEFGHNSPELLQAKERSMKIWAKMQRYGIQ